MVKPKLRTHHRKKRTVIWQKSYLYTPFNKYERVEDYRGAWECYSKEFGIWSLLSETLQAVEWRVWRVEFELWVSRFLVAGCSWLYNCF